MGTGINLQLSIFAVLEIGKKKIALVESLAQLDSRLIQLLALQRIQQLGINIQKVCCSNNYIALI